MSSLTLKGKASEHGSLASANATTTPDLTTSNPSSGSYGTYCPVSYVFSSLSMLLLIIFVLYRFH